MDDVSTVVAGIGAMADETLDSFVRFQTVCPLNFKDLTEVLLAGRCPHTVDFFLASVAATAIIRLAAVVSVAESVTECVVCHHAADRSGLCDDHKYDEQKEFES